jgi:hypothetical protein
MLIKKMKIKLFILFILFTSCFCAAAQRQKLIIQNVVVPDSIKLRLLHSTYEYEDNLTIQTGLYIFNLQNRKNLRLENSLYSFQGMGSHFPKKIFIYHDKQFFIFKSIGAFDIESVLSDFLVAIRELKLSEKDKVKYLRLITKYLEEELGQTYGTEIGK